MLTSGAPMHNAPCKPLPHPRPMHVGKFAFATVDHPDAEVFEADSTMPWPGHVGERVVWVTRPLPAELGDAR